MSAVKHSTCAKRAQVFAPKEEGWSESVSINFNEEIDGYVINEETGEKELTKVSSLSVFIGDVIKAMANNPSVSAFLTAKSREEKIIILPVLLAGAKVEYIREHIESEKKFITELLNITLTDMMLARIEKALDALLGF